MNSLKRLPEKMSGLWVLNARSHFELEWLRKYFQFLLKLVFTVGRVPEKMSVLPRS